MNTQSFVAISGLNFPFRSRQYFMSMVKDYVEAKNAMAVIVAGHVLAGRELLDDLKLRLKSEKDKTKHQKINVEFIHEMAEALNEFLPHINKANYHIVVAKKIYDFPIGVTILERLAKMRNDIRLFDDPETKIPIQLDAFGDMRVIVPRKTPWFYENITGLMQRLVNSFAFKTNSPKPRLILVGCTGTGGVLPYYKGVYCVAVPALHKIDEQLSTENMVGCVCVKISGENENFKFETETLDFRTAMFNEKVLALPDGLSRCHTQVIEALLPSSASLKTVEFRLNKTVRKPWANDKVQKVLDELKDKKLVIFNEKGNRYAIRESLHNETHLTLNEFFKNSKKIRLVVKSCWHVGSLKTLYFTVMEREPLLAIDADATIINGDIQQGISHNYEYNGELNPLMNGIDKHELGAARMQACINMNTFAKRYEQFKGTKLPLMELVDKCLILFGYNIGNHDEPRFSHGKNAIALQLFDTEFRKEIVSELIGFLETHGHKNIPFNEIQTMVNEKIMRIGESRTMVINGVTIGLQHPRQGGSQNMGAHIQRTTYFFDKALADWPNKEFQNIPLILVANFHSAAAIHTSQFGRTVFGVMTGAMLKDTEFEKNINKVVDHGMAKVTLVLNKDNQILSSNIIFDDEIVEADERIVFADNLSSDDVIKQTAKLNKIWKLPYR